MNKHLLSLILYLGAASATAQHTFTFGTDTNPQGTTFRVDSRGIRLNDHPVIPVMGEIHYSRVPQKEWRREIQKMKAGGITLLSTYVFWIHHEAEEGRWNWSGNRNLHAFLQICAEEQMPVVLRLGPFCHGEVYQGGIPKWIVEKAQSNQKQYKLRSEAKGFLAATQRLYSNIMAQATGMLWKQGGPIVGIQLENECRGPWSYYMALKRMAVEVGFDVPFYTRTGWPKLNDKEDFGQMLPLYGDYADGFWDRKLTDMPGEYTKAFKMKHTRVSGAIATETFGTNQDTSQKQQDLQYPYLTCELGGGMMPSYHRRINISGREAMPLAVCKLGSGSNLPAYYMYHGGSNPTDAHHTLAETQASPVTNYNDMPLVSYDFQCPLGEMGQPNITAYTQTRHLHQFLSDWGAMLSQMDVDSLSECYARRGCFEFRNDYVRIHNEAGQAGVFPVQLPFGGHSVSATAQPFCHIGDTLYLIPILDTKATATVDSKKIKLKADKPQRVGNITLYLLSEQRAARAYKIDGRLHFAAHEGGILFKDGDRICEEWWSEQPLAHSFATRFKAADAPREIKMGQQKVAAMPMDKDFEAAAVYHLNIDSLQLHSNTTVDNFFLQIDYAADCARIYADGQLVQDNFWNGKPMLVRLSQLHGKRVELRILPLRKDAPIYLQTEQRKLLQEAEGDILLQLKGISLLQRQTNAL